MVLLLSFCCHIAVFSCGLLAVFSLFCACAMHRENRMGGFRRGGSCNNRFVLKTDVAIASEVSNFSKNSLAITDSSQREPSLPTIAGKPPLGTPPSAIPNQAGTIKHSASNNDTKTVWEFDFNYVATSLHKPATQWIAWPMSSAFPCFDLSTHKAWRCG